MATREKRKKCSEEAFRSLVFAMNKTKDEVVVENNSLLEVLDCHEHYRGHEPAELVVKSGRKKTVVDRKVLFKFVNDHGDICGRV